MNIGTKYQLWTPLMTNYLYQYWPCEKLNHSMSEKQVKKNKIFKEKEILFGL